MNRLAKRVYELARAQHGVVAYRQLGVLGVGKSLHGRMLREGEWVRVLPSVVRMYWAEPTWMLRAWAGLLWAGSTATLSHGSAAVLCGFDVLAEDVELTDGRNGARAEARWIHVYRRLGTVETVMLAGLRVTAPARTLVDLAPRLEDAELARVWRQVLRYRMVSVASVRQVLSRLGQGIAGIARVRQLVE
jgi:hypothetical protein